MKRGEIFRDPKVPGMIYIRSDYGFKDKIQALPSRKWNKAKRLWEAKAMKANILPILGWIRSGWVSASPDLVKEMEAKLETLKPQERRQWPPGYRFKTQPMKKQMEAIEFCYSVDRWNLPAEMGCGKTKIFMDVMSAHLSAGKIDGIVAISRVNLRANWIREYEKHCPLELNTYVLESTKASVKRLKNLKPPFLVSVGVESLQGKLFKGQVFEALLEVVQNHRLGMGVDEAHLIKSHKANRSRNVDALGAYAKYKGIMTGTPVPKDILDLYMQMHFLDPDILGHPSFFSFKLTHAVLGGFNGKEILSFRDTDKIMKDIDPYTFRMYRSDVVDLPPLTRRAAIVHLTPDMKKAYATMKRERMIELKDQRITAPVVISMYTRLRGLSSGYIYDDEKNIQWIEDPEKTPKAKELKSIFENTREQMIIWVSNHAEIQAVEKTLGKNVVSFHGKKTTTEREEALADFKAGKYQAIVATVASMQTGLTLTEATLEIFYSLPLSYSDFIQAEARAYRIGQDKKVLVLMMVTEGTIDMDILAALLDKKDVHDYVMEKPDEIFIESTIDVAKTTLIIE